MEQPISASVCVCMCVCMCACVCPPPNQSMRFMEVQSGW